MQTIRICAFILLAVYNVALIAIELRTSQDFVRYFFTDIYGPVPFYAVNTTLTVFLMWASALLFLVSLVCIAEVPESRRLRWFLLSQVLMFSFLGFDDRFQFHEKVAWRLEIGDHYIILIAATVESLFLVLLGGRPLLKSKANKYLCLGILLFAVMLGIDAFVQHDLVLRLSAEDLAKTWASAFFYLFAWETCMQQINRLKAA